MVDTWKVVDKKDAPPRPAKAPTSSATTNAIRELLQKMKVGQLVQIPMPELQEGQDPKNRGKGIRISVGRIASNAGIKVSSYESGEFIWVERLPNE